MPHLPDFETFQRLADGHQLVPVYRQLLSDALTPVSAFHQLDRGGHAFLFESVIGGEKVGRYSFLAPSRSCGSRPAARRSPCPRRRPASGTFDVRRPAATSSQTRVDARIAPPHLPELPPFAGGAVGYAGYDTVRYVENLPNAPPDDRGLPDLSFAFYDRMVVFDHVSKTILVVAHGPRSTADGDAAGRVRRRLPPRRRAGRAPAAARRRPAAGRHRHRRRRRSSRYTSNFTQRRSSRRPSRKCEEYIQRRRHLPGRAQPAVRRSRRRAEPFDIYRTLRVVNPSPFMFYLRTPDG